MILAVPELEHAFRRHIGCSRRGVDAHHTSLQVVDAQYGLIQCAFTCAPTVCDGQVVERRRQSIIGQVTRFDRAANAPPEGPLMLFDPRLDARKPVVTLGEDAGQPHDRRPAQAQSLPIAIGWEVCVQ